jgi:hypothetical protein
MRHGAWVKQTYGVEMVLLNAVIGDGSLYVP